MNWDRVEGQWKQRRGKAVHHWGKLMNDELATIAGKHEEFVGILQEKYGIAKEEAKRQVDGFTKIVDQLKKSNARLMRMQKSAGKNGKPHKTPAAAKRTSANGQKRKRVKARS
ncbi:MAG: CsbD family protein [Bacteroidota bacterium]